VLDHTQINMTGFMRRASVLYLLPISLANYVYLLFQSVLGDVTSYVS